MKSTRIYKSLLALAAPMLFAACGNDADVVAPNTNDNFEGITLNIPNTGLNTRAGESTVAVSSTEAKINNLVVLAYKQVAETTKPAPEVFEFSGADFTDAALSSDAYKMVRVPLAAGDYHIYVLANIGKDEASAYNVKADDSNIRDWKALTEANMASATLVKSGADVNIAPFVEGKALPMTCNYKAIRKTATSSSGMGTVFDNGLVTITAKQATSVWADLSICVAKVRYTILNNASSILKMDATSPVSILNYDQSIGLMTPKAAANQIIATAAKTLSGGGYFKCPEYTSAAPTSVDNLAALEDADKDEDGLPKADWAYQGIVYVPERLFTLADNTVTNPTKIKFTFSESAYNEKGERELGANGTSVPSDWNGTDGTYSGVVRGVFYDVVGFTTKKTIELQVRVRSWEYHKYTIDLE